jgi:hypothetical protein
LKNKKNTLIILAVLAFLAVGAIALTLVNINANKSEQDVAPESVRVFSSNFDGTLDMEELKALPKKTVQQKIQSSKHEDEEGKFTGVLLSALAEHFDKDYKEKYSQFVAKASDGYLSAYSLSESSSVILVYEKDGKETPPRTIFVNYPFGNRNVRDLISIELKP